jgi:hypothetical protein
LTDLASSSATLAAHIGLDFLDAHALARERTGVLEYT